MDEENVRDIVPSEEQGDGEVEELRIPSFDEWITETLLICEHVGRAGGGRFCAEWWNHPEAVARFKALYQQYVKCAAEGELSSWWVQHWDVHARALFDPQTGVFHRCGASHEREDSESIRGMVGGQPVAEDFSSVVHSGNPKWV